MERESSLGGRLRRLMEEEGLSYEQLGERLGMNPQTLNRYVLGQREPKIGTASAMAAALGVDPLWLLGYDVPPPYRTAAVRPHPGHYPGRAAHGGRAAGGGLGHRRRGGAGGALLPAGHRRQHDQRRYPGRGSGAAAAAGYGGERPDCGLSGGQGRTPPSKALPPPAGHGALQPENPAYEPKLIPLSDLRPARPASWAWRCAWCGNYKKERCGMLTEDWMMRQVDALARSIAYLVFQKGVHGLCARRDGGGRRAGRTPPPPAGEGQRRGHRRGGGSASLRRAIPTTGVIWSWRWTSMPGSTT